MKNILDKIENEVYNIVYTKSSGIVCGAKVRRKERQMKQYISPEIQIVTVSMQDIMNGSQETEVDLNGESLFDR